MGVFRKAAAAGAVALGLAVFPLAAQDKSGEATAYLFFTDADGYMSVNSWWTVRPERGFLVLGSNGSSLNLGFAKNLGGLYLGASYKGSFLQGGGGDGVKVEKTSVYDGASSVWERTVTTETYASGTTHSENEGAVLLGLGGDSHMAFKVSFSENLDSRSLPGGSYFTTPGGAPVVGVTTENADGTKTVDGLVSDYKYLSGTMEPKVDWTMTFMFDGGLEISPGAGLGFGIHSASESWTSESKTTVNGVQSGSAEISKYGSYSDYLAPDIKASVGMFKPLWGGKFSASAEYGVSFGLYSNPTGSGGDAAAGFTTYAETDTSGDNASVSRTSTLAEQSSVTHKIPLSAKYIIDLLDKRVSLGAGAGLEFSVSSAKAGQTETTNYTKTADSEITTVSYNGQDVTTDIFGIKPELKTGAIVYIIPEKLRLNFGLKMNPFVYTSTTITQDPTKIGYTTTKNADGTVETVSADSVDDSYTAVSSESHSENWATFAAALSGGLTLELGGFTVDALVTAPFGSGLQVNPWGFVNGSYSILLSYKF